LGVRNRTIEVRMIPSNVLDLVVSGDVGVPTLLLLVSHGFVLLMRVILLGSEVCQDSFFFWYEWRDLNSHVFRRSLLRAVCIPIPPHSLKRWSSPAAALQQDTLKVSYLRIKSTPQLDALSPTSSFFFPVAFPNRANRLSARFSCVSFHNFRALSCSRLRSDMLFLLVSGYYIYL
jgi:hypothetical protein